MARLKQEPWQPEATEQDAAISHLRRLRVLRGLSRRALSERTGVGVRTIAYLEAGEHEPQLKTARALAAGLGVKDVSAAFPGCPSEYRGEHRRELVSVAVTTLRACRRLADPALPASVRGELCAELAPELDHLIEASWPL
jgi:transcriptional regulator with XRE-family HTH domain